MPDVPGQSLRSRKRRRQAVVCTSCRRRKIACDRNAPCVQCVQAELECIYYGTYPHSDFQISRHDIANSKSSSSSSAPSTQATQQDYGPGLPSESRANVDHERNLSYISDYNFISKAPASIHLDMSGPSWLDTEIFGALNQPLNAPIDSDAVSIFSPDNRTALSDRSQEMGLSALLSPHSQAESFSAYQGKAVLSRTRLYGPTHWKTILHKYEQQGLFEDVVNVLFRGEGHSLLQKCKKLAREVKSQKPDSQSLSRPLRDYVPVKETCDELIRLYLRTFEAVLRVLHVPSFERDYLQYWSNPPAASESFVLQLLLIMAIGTCFYEDGAVSDGAATLHCKAAHWIHACRLRLAEPFQKEYLNLRGVQSKCLLVIVLLTNTNITGDLAWISVASLLQSAMAVGVHIAPSQLPISPLEAEIRRRLWVTILELAVQCSLDSGIHPLVSAEALNCEIPSNLNDAQISDSTEALPKGHPRTMFTQSSIQCELLTSLPVRLRIAQALSQFPAELPYETALRLGEELTAACRKTSKAIDLLLVSSSTVDDARPSSFHIKMQDLLARRFLLLLHLQFAHKATSDVAYHFSRTVCQECSLLLLSPLSSQSINKSAGEDTSDDYNGGTAVQDYANLQLFGNGLFKNVFLAASLAVCAEVLQQLREDSSPSTSSLSRRELLQALGHVARLTKRRVHAGETSVKAAAFFTCILAQIGARSPLVIADNARTTLGECCAALEVRLREQTRNLTLVTNDGSSRFWVQNLPLTSRGERPLSNSSQLSFDSTDTWHALSWEDHTSFSC